MILVAAVALVQMLSVCAPNAGRRTMAAIVRVESDGMPLAIHDNDLNRTFEPRDVNQAVVWANQLLALHHSVDLGISQINAFNLPHLGLSVRDAFDPCMNLRGGATILASDYRAAALEFGAGQFALRRAIGAYNSGSLYAGSTYIHRILEAAGIDADEGFPIPDLQVGSEPLGASQLRPVLQRAARHVTRNKRAVAPAANPFAAPLLVGMPQASTANPPVQANGARAAVAAPTPIVLRPSGGNPEGSPIFASTPAKQPAPTLTSSPAANPAPSSLPKPSPAPPAATS